MTLPALPAKGTADWYAYIQALDNEVRTGIGGTVTVTSADITDATPTGVNLLTAADATAARAAISAGTSNLAIGTTATTAKAGDWKPAAVDVTDSTATGRAVLTAADAAAARTAIGAGTSNLALGTTASTAKAGDYAPPTASDTAQGVVELATPAEAVTGTDATRAVTPAGLKAHTDAIGTSGGTVNALVRRDAGGNASFGQITVFGPTLPDHVVRKQDLDAGLAGSTPPALALYSNSAAGAVGAGSRAFTVANQMIWVPVNVPVPTTLTGVRIRRGAATVTANVITALYNAAGTRVAVSGTVAEGTSSFVALSLPFSATYAAAAGIYWVGLIGSSTSADFHGWSVNEYLGPATAATQGSFATPTSFTPPALTSVSSVTVPLVLLY